MNQALIDYLATLARSHIALRDALQTLTEQVAQMTAFDPAPILAQLSDLGARVTTHGDSLAELAGRVQSLDSRMSDTTAVVTALAGKVAELQQAGAGDLSGLPAL
jgi:hypothetical protein